MGDSFKLRFGKNSKRNKKEFKYIPAAIIPSAAFIANPTRPTIDPTSDEITNKLMSSSLSSSLIGLNAEYKKHLIDKSNDSDPYDEYNESNSVERQRNDEQSGSTKKQSIRKSKKKNKQTSENDNDSKRRIRIASGIHYEVNTVEAVPKDKENSEFNLSSNHLDRSFHGSAYSLDHSDEDKPFKDVQLPYVHKKLGFEYIENEINSKPDRKVSPILDRRNRGDVVESGQEFILSSNHRDRSFHGLPYSLDHSDENKPFKDVQLPFTHKKLGFEYIENEINSKPDRKVVSNLDGSKREDVVASGQAFREMVNNTGEHYSPYPINETIYPVPTNFKDTNLVNADGELDPVYSVSAQSVRNRTTRQEGDDKNIRQLREEIRLLKDINYRLNIEIGELLPEQENGRSIGKSVFPGKGPVPNWIMNTKYLAPLLTVYDRKFQQQNRNIMKMKESIVEFENEIRQVISENKQLHSLLHEKKKCDPTNGSEWLAIIEQTKLVIEENQLLLKELDIEQQRNKELEKNFVIEVSQLKTSLSTVAAERDMCNKEIVSLIGKITGLQGSSNLPSSKNDSSMEINLLKNQIDDLHRNKKSLESDIGELRDKERRMEKKLEKLKVMLNSEKEFRQYLSDVIDKGNEISNERDVLSDMITVWDSEIKRITNKLLNEIKYNFDIGVDLNSTDLSMRNSGDATINQLYQLETWMLMLVQSAEDLNNRCKHQEKDVHYYQNLLKEKDILLQEREKNNEELEVKLDLLWKNATRDS